jgi:hypothetical protein
MSEMRISAKSRRKTPHGLACRVGQESALLSRVVRIWQKNQGFSPWGPWWSFDDLLPPDRTGLSGNLTPPGPIHEERILAHIWEVYDGVTRKKWSKNPQKRVKNTPKKGVKKGSKNPKKRVIFYRKSATPGYNA